MRKLIVVLLLACPVFATEPNPSAKQRELVERILKEMNLDASLHNIADQMFADMEKDFIGGGEDPEEARETFMMFRERAKKIDFGRDIHDAYVRIYSRYFTEKDLTTIADFYATPAGQRMVEVLPHLMSDAMKMGASEFGPKIEQVMEEVREEQEKKRPWRRTMRDIRMIATAVEAWSTDNDGNYPDGDIAALEKALVPTYVKTLPQKDMWGHAYAYNTSEDHKHYRIASAGADSVFEWDSLHFNPLPKETHWSDRLEDDLIYGDGQYIQMPAQARPKTKE